MGKAEKKVTPERLHKFNMTSSIIGQKWRLEDFLFYFILLNGFIPLMIACFVTFFCFIRWYVFVSINCSSCGIFLIETHLILVSV